MLHHERILIGVLLTCVAVAVCHSQYLGRKTIKLKNSKGFNAKIYRFHNKHALVVRPATKYSSTIVLQTRRHKIIKCCGTRSCSNIISKTKNGTRTLGGSNKKKDQDAGSGSLPGAGKDVLSSNSNANTGNVTSIKNSGPAGSSGQDGAKQSDPVDGSGSISEGADSSNKPAGGGDSSGGGSSDGDPAEGGAAPPAAEATTLAAAVGYTGRTAGEDGDYGDPDAPSTGSAAAPPGGGDTTSGSGGGTTGAGGTAAGIGANSGGSSTISSGSGSAPIGGGTNATGSGGGGTNATGSGGGGTNATGSGGSPTGGATGNATGGAPSGTSNTTSTGAGSNTGSSNSSTSTLGSNSTSTGNLANSPNSTSNSSAPNSGSGGSGSNTSTSGSTGLKLNGTDANSTSGSGTPNSSSTNSSSSTNGTAISSIPASDNSTASGSNAGSSSTGASPAPGGASSAGSAVSAGSASTVKSATIKPKPDPCVDDGCVGACDKDVNHAAANKACCAMGMSLASFKTKDEQTCMTDYTKNTLKVEAVYFMGATDNACYKKFLWCSGIEIKILDYKWLSGQPNYLFGNQHCIAHVIDFGGFMKAADNGLNDWECHSSNQYLCE